jgi:hypothetical protein
MALVALIVTGCGWLPGSSPATSIAGESMPSPASIQVIGDPAVAVRQVGLTLMLPDQPAFRRDIAIGAGEAIVGDFPVSSGTYRLVGPDGACALDVTLAPETNTIVLLRATTDDTCSLTVVATNPNGY